MSDKHDFPALVGVAFHLHVDFGHQRAGRVEHRNVSRRGFVLHALWHTVSGKHHGRAIGNIIQLVHENRPGLAQPIDNIAIVYDLVADIDRCPEQVERAFDDVDGAVDAGAKAAGVGK